MYSISFSFGVTFEDRGGDGNDTGDGVDTAADIFVSGEMLSAIRCSAAGGLGAGPLSCDRRRSGASSFLEI